VSLTSSPGRPPGSSPEASLRPAPASGLVLLGELAGSGYRTPPALVRRPDGQTIQLTALLYLVLEAIDGERTFAEIAAVVSAAYGRQVGEDDVRLLTETKLRPLGLLRATDGTEPELRKPNPLLALRLRWVVSDPAVTRRMTAPFAALFNPVVVALVLAAFAAISTWVLFTKGLGSATHQAFDQPLLLLLVFAITIFSAGFHEFGHASACRYGGATPGAMGTGLYLVWPAFYTDVTDSYRLGRGGRLRVDLGGLYFNAVVAVVMFGVWAVTRWDALLLILATQLLQMVRQLAPMVRFDGYHVLADLTGVPDLYSRMGPTLRSLIPGHRADARATALKPWARAVVTAWVLVIVPLLLFTLVLMVLALPRVLATAWGSLANQAHALSVDWAGGDVAGVAVRMLAIVAVSLPVLGSLLTLVRLVRSTTASGWRATRGRPGRRAVAVLVASALVAGLAWAWWPDANRYRPIQAFERGAIIDGLAASGLTQPQLRDGQVVSAPRTVWASTSTPPTKGHPELALVLVPKGAARSGGAAGRPAWVFPFNRPGPPGSGDNQALAVNTKDGSSLYDVAFALVWADRGIVTNRNEAYAFASCTSCTTVAVAFQVVLVVGQADVAIPQNLSGAVNYSCARCVTYALAQQLVLTVPGDLSADQRRRLDGLWQEISTFAASLQSVPLDQIRNRLLGFQDQARALVREAARPAPAPSSSATPTGAGTTTTTPGAEQPSPSPTASLAQVPTPTGTAPGSSAPATTAAAPTTAPPAAPSSSSSPSDSSAPEPSGSPSTTP
jgi:putative peptide zinc metalloprotease protein